MAFVGLPRPYGVTDPALMALYRAGQERLTGLTGTALTLSNAPVPGSLLLFKNGALMDEVAGAAGFSIEGPVITLGTAAIVGDVFFAQFHFRGSREG